MREYHRKASYRPEGPRQTQVHAKRKMKRGGLSLRAKMGTQSVDIWFLKDCREVPAVGQNIQACRFRLWDDMIVDPAYIPCMVTEVADDHLKLQQF